MIERLVLGGVLLYSVVVTLFIYSDTSVDGSNRIAALVQDCTYIQRIILDGYDLALADCKGKPYVFNSVK